MKTAGYIGKILPDGHLSIAPDVVRELGLHPNEQVQVVLIFIPQTADDNERSAAERAKVWRQVDALRERLSGKNFSLTDSLLQAREEEDERAQKRHEAIEGLLALRKEFAGMDFNLTDEIVRMREEEDV